MTWTDYKYFSTWVDPQGRTHRVELYPDNYTAGSQTEYDAGVRPLTYNFGSPTDDEFRPLNPTDVSAEMVVPDETLFDDIAGDGDQTWGLMWKISGTEVWRGFVLPDQLVQSVESVDTTLVVNAVCGLVYVEDTDWTPAAGARDTLVAIGADALGQVGHGLQIGAAADWHASGQSGNSYGVYKTDEYALKDTENERQDGKYASPAVFLQQIAGRFAGKLFQARGKWRLIQREEVTGSSYAQDVYNSSGVDTAANETVSRVEIDTSTNPKYPGTTKRIARRYEKAVVRYAHGPLGNSMFQNRSFEYWSGTPSLPESWTEWSDEVGDEGAPDVGQNPSTIVSRDTAHQALTWNFWNSQGSGNSPGTAIESNSAALIPAISGTGVAKALVGIKQDASGSVSASQGLIFSVDARLKLDGAIGSESVDARPFWVSIWIDGDAGTDYYFDGNPASANYQTWVSGTMATPPDAAKIQLNAGYLDRSWFRFEIDASLDGAITFPDAGTLRVILYNVVETDSGTALEGILYDNVDVTIVGSSQESDGVTYTVSTGGTGSGTHDGGTWFWGQGPTSSHPGRLTHGAGTYSSAWSSSGGAEAASLDKLHADRLLKAKENANTVLSTSFRMGSGTYWPDQALLYDSDEYTCVHLEYDAGRDEYQGTFVTTGVSSLSPGDATGSSQQLLYAPDAEGALFGLLNAETVPPKGDGLQYRVGLDSIPDGQEFLKWNIDGAPPGATNVSGSGLYVGTDKMGYYNGSKWTTYMDSSGNMKLVDSDGAKTFLIYVDDGATEQLSFSIEAATALGGYVILNSEDAEQMQILAEDASVTLYGSNSSTAPGEPAVTIEGDLMAGSAGHTIGDGAVGSSWAGAYIYGPGEFSVLAGGEATAEGVTLRNTTAATVSVDQFSPALRWEGRGWETTTGTSDAVVFQSYVETIKGTAASGSWHLQASINGGAYSDVFVVGSDGAVSSGVWNAGIIKAPTGTAGAPSITFTTDTDTGLYWIGADNIGVSLGGANVIDISTARVIFQDEVRVQGGTVSNPQLTFDGDTDTGIYRLSANSLGITAGGSNIATFDSAGITTGDITCSDIEPGLDGFYDCGASAKRWVTVYTENINSDGGTVTLTNLPTSGGGATGTLWNDSGTIKIN